MGGVAVLLSTQTRGALIGAAAAGAISFPAWSRWARRNRLALAAVVVVVITGASLAGLGSRLVDAVDFTDGAAAGRVDEWTTGLDAVETSPLLGSGFEGYRIVFPSVVSAQYTQDYGRTFATDRSHNGLIDVAIWSGLIGAALYVSAVVFLVRRAWQATRLGDPWLVGISAAVVGYLVQQQFLFPLAEVDGAFWLTAGILVAHTRPSDSLVQPRLITRYVALLLGAAVATFGVTDVLADHLAKQAIATSAIDNPEPDGWYGYALVGDVVLLEEAVDLRPESIDPVPVPGGQRQSWHRPCPSH